MGQLTESIYSYQIQEMKEYQNAAAAYIRDGRNTFYLKTKGKVEIYENVGYRFLLLSKNFNEEHFRGVASYTMEELEEFVGTQPDNCTLDLHIAMRQLNKNRVLKFINEISKQQEVENVESPTQDNR